MEKSFDCLKMKEAVQAEIYEEVRGMNSTQLYEYWKNLEKEYVALKRMPAPDKSLARSNQE